MLRPTLPSATLVLLVLLPGLLGGAWGYRVNWDEQGDQLIREAAFGVYGHRPYAVHPADDDAFAAAFPDLRLYAVVEPTVAPVEIHLMAYHPLLGKGYDLTRGFNAILQDTGATVLSAESAVVLARVYAHLANAEVATSRRLVGPADSGWLARDVPAPVATAMLDGWDVALWTWADANGVLAEWTVRFRLHQVSTAEWSVRALATGPHHVDAHAVHIPAGTSFLNEHLSTGHRLSAYEGAIGASARLLLPAESRVRSFTAIHTATNFDGSVWVVHYPTQHLPAPPEILATAQAIADAGVHAYGLQVSRNPTGCAGAANPSAHWGFESKDRDCRLDVYVAERRTLLCSACTERSEEARLHVSAAFLAQLRAFQWYVNPTLHTERSVARIVVGHEHFHNLQYALNQMRPESQRDMWSALYEGQARFVETLLDPAVVQDPSSGWYMDGNYHQGMSHQALCADTGYRHALFWGYLYWKDGGMATLRAALDAVAADAPSCAVGLPQAIGAALAAAPGLHDDHAAARTDFSLHAYARDFRWGAVGDPVTHDWGKHLGKPKGTAWTEQAVGTKEHALGSWGIRYVQPKAGVHLVSCEISTGTQAFLLREEGGTLTRQPYGCATTPLQNGAGVVMLLQFVQTSSDRPVRVSVQPG